MKKIKIKGLNFQFIAIKTKKNLGFIEWGFCLVIQFFCSPERSEGEGNCKGGRSGQPSTDLIELLLVATQQLWDKIIDYWAWGRSVFKSETRSSKEMWYPLGSYEGKEDPIRRLPRALPSIALYQEDRRNKSLSFGQKW